MSVLQKLFNLVHSCPRASHFKVRDLNIYFKDAINPTYKLINLDHIDSLELQIESEDKDYNLVAFILKNSKESVILLGTFDTKKEAEDALHQVKNKIFGGGKTLLGMANGIVLLLVYTSLILSFANFFKADSNAGMPNLSSLSTGGMPSMNLGGSSGGNVDMAAMSKLQKSLLQQALQQAGQQGITGVANVPNIPNLPNNSNAMNNIVSDAIQQGQNQNPVDGQPNSQLTNPQVTNTPQAVEQQKSPGDDLLSQMKK